MNMEALENYAYKNLGSALLDYYGIWPWLKRRTTQATSPHSKTTFNSVAAFWNSAINSELRLGQKVRFKNAILTEWVPRRPGALWKNSKVLSGLSALSSGERYYLQKAVYLDPFGVIRYPVTGHDTAFTCLGLTTDDAWRCDLGIPLVVSRTVANEFRAKAGAGRAAVAEITGLLEFGSPLLAGAKHLRSQGCYIETAALEAIRRSSSIPMCHLYCGSLQDIRARQHDSHPPGYLWAIQKVQTVSHAYGALNKRKQAPVEALHDEPAWEYRLEAACLDLTEKDQVNNFAAIVKAGGCQKDVFPPGPEREEGVLDVQVLTEFDARSQYFDHPIRISTDPTLQVRDTQLFEECLLELVAQVWGS
jgi:hypothetical protein